jgi:8-oxo-dGTP pyrophosphatase MutT (NUDIX family)
MMSEESSLPGRAGEAEPLSLSSSPFNLEGSTSARRIARWCAGALLVCGERYLMQLRDDKPNILLPNHWSLFGGTVDPGETAGEAILRELAEELEFRAREAVFFTELSIVLPFPSPRCDRMSFFMIEVTESDLDAMVQHEGAGRALFTAAALAEEPRVAPWDLAVVLMHARQSTLFGR